eukprot:1471454-Rhodomonas_salina.1
MTLRGSDGGVAGGQHRWFEGEVECLCEQLGSMEERMQELSGAVAVGEAKARRQVRAHLVLLSWSSSFLAFA